MTKGCIQGSVCGPTFWNLILDDLLNIDLPEGCYIQAFADDVFLLVDAVDVDNLSTMASDPDSSKEIGGHQDNLPFASGGIGAVTFPSESYGM